MLTRFAHRNDLFRGFGHDVERLFDNVFGDWSSAPSWESGFALGRQSPALKIWEDEQAYHAEAEVPGLRLEDLEILVEGHDLSVRGERKSLLPEGATRHRHERKFGSFERVVRLPSEIDPEKVEASLESGVLTITLPKAEAAKPRRIEVRPSTS